MLDWRESYSASWRIFRVDPDTWADAGEVAGIDSVSVDLTDSGEMVSGTLEATAGAVDPGYMKVVMTATQGEEVERVEIATLLVESTSRKLKGGAWSVSLDGRSVLHPAATCRVFSPAYAPSGSDGAQLAGEILGQCIAAPVVVEGSFTLSSDVVFDPGGSALDAAWLVLKAGNHVIQVHGDGTVHILPKPVDVAILLDDAHAALLMPEMDCELDYGDVPNRYIAVDDGLVEVVANEDAASPTSRGARGYWIDVYDASPKYIGGETLAQYAERRLAELSTVHDARSYTREWWPGVYPGSIARGGLSTAGLDGDMRISGQSYECGAGVVVTEKAYVEVRTWEP